MLKVSSTSFWPREVDVISQLDPQLITVPCVDYHCLWFNLFIGVGAYSGIAVSVLLVLKVIYNYLQQRLIVSLAY